MTLTKQILKLSKPLICFLSLFLSGGVQAQIEYNWQNSKEGWVPANDCNLTAQNESMAMRSFHLYPVMRSGTLNENLGIDASECTFPVESKLFRQKNNRALVLI